jgi:putative tryptophan/tyrosine transport system substrate-binding protein
MMKRREFIAWLGGTVAWACVARAQGGAPPVIGYLTGGSEGQPREGILMFLQALSQAGYVAGKNLSIEYRWALGNYERLPALAAELVARKVRVIVTPDSGTTARAAMAATSTIPIVFAVGSDPVQEGLVASFNHPGGNLTGAVRLSVEVEPKRLQMLHELVPGAKTLGLLVNPDNPNAEASTQQMRAAALSMQVGLSVFSARSNADLDRAFGEIAAGGVGGLAIAPDTFFITRSERLAQLSLTHRVPAIFQYRPFVASGGLAAYGSDPIESYQLVGLYTARILKGEQPRDLPVQEVGKLKLFINMTTASALNLSVPQSLMAFASELID